MTSTTQTSEPASRKRSLKSLVPGDSIRLRRIVLPIDLSSDAVKGIDSAVDLAKRFGSDLFLVHVYEEPVRR